MNIVNDAAASNANSYLNAGHTYSLPAGAQSTFLAGQDGTSFRPDEVEVFYETTWKTVELGFLALYTLCSKIKLLQIW